jgi:hypothetical protein
MVTPVADNPVRLIKRNLEGSHRPDFAFLESARANKTIFVPVGRL